MAKIACVIDGGVSALEGQGYILIHFDQREWRGWDHIIQPKGPDSPFGLLVGPRDEDMIGLGRQLVDDTLSPTQQINLNQMGATVEQVAALGQIVSFCAMLQLLPSK